MNIKLIILSLFRTLIILTIVLSPILSEQLFLLINKSDIAIDLERNLQTMSLVLLAVGMSNYFTSNIKKGFSHVFFTFYPFLLIIILTLVNTSLSINNQKAVNADFVLKIITVSFISSFLYYFIVNIFIEMNKEEDNFATTVEVIKIQFKFPDFLKQ